MELIAMALILSAVLIAQYYIYSRLGQKHLNYTLTVKRRGTDGGAVCGEYAVEAYEDEEIEIVEEIDNAKLLPLPWVRTEINCSRWLTFFGNKESAALDKDSQKGLISGIFTLKGRQKCRRTWRVKCEKRGVFTIDDVSIAVSDLFGLVKSARVMKLGMKIRVLPVPADMDSCEMSNDVYIGDIPVRRFVLPDPFVISGAREYTGREPMNRIHWAQSARNGSLMVYNNEFTTERRVLIILNMQRSYHSGSREMPLSAQESLIKGAAFMLDYCLKTHTVCALAANSEKPVEPAAGEGSAFTLTLLRTLAELRSGCAEHIDDLTARLDYTDWTDVVFVSSFLDERCAELLRRLSENGRSVCIFSTDLEETDFCEVRHIPRKKYHIPEIGE